MFFASSSCLPCFFFLFFFFCFVSFHFKSSSIIVSAVNEWWGGDIPIKYQSMQFASPRRTHRTTVCLTMLNKLIRRRCRFAWQRYFTFRMQNGTSNLLRLRGLIRCWTNASPVHGRTKPSFINWPSNLYWYESPIRWAVTISSGSPSFFPLRESLKASWASYKKLR